MGKFLVTRTVVYTKEVQANDEKEAVEFAQEIGWHDSEITDDSLEAEQ